MTGNKVPPRSAYGIPADRIVERQRRGDRGRGGAPGSGGMGTQDNVFDPLATAKSLTNEGAEYGRTNPPFIYPGENIRLGATGVEKPVKRGYIRRLTEFYTKLIENQNLADTTSTIQNLRCNFQFNPDSITRSIEARADMQFFFNQEPSQLAQPIPGNAGFAFELLFNREAELHSNQYINKNGGLNRGYSGPGRTPEFFINQAYDPAWVTEIGVLADIMVLDDIVGQGIAKDIFRLQQSGVFSFASTEESDTAEDEGDKEDTPAPKTWDSKRLEGLANSANLGNKAFLVPTPVRIMFSPWLMIEGFVQRYSVTFNKFTPEMIPSQAIVAVQMQALYVGFAQQKTFLTDIPDLDPDGDDAGADVPPPGTKEREQYDETLAALSGYLDKVRHIQGSEGPQDILDYFFLNPNNEQEVNFFAQTSKAGKDFYENSADKNKGGGGLYFSVKGEIKVWWDAHVSNATNERGRTRTTAVPSGGTIQYTAGPPPNDGATDYSIFGTSASPFIATLDEIPVHYVQQLVPGFSAGSDYLVLGQIRRFQLGWPYNAAGTKAMWKWAAPGGGGVRTPFQQDRFNVTLELTLLVKRYQLEGVESPQKIRGRWLKITANDDVLFENVTPDKKSNPPGPVRGTPR